jgi:hypothetical protein
MLGLHRFSNNRLGDNGAVRTSQSLVFTNTGLQALKTPERRRLLLLQRYLRAASDGTRTTERGHVETVGSQASAVAADAPAVHY